jgi:tetratricopeptide (TPR) repeat protein
LQELKRFEQAIARLDRALEIEPDNAQARENRDRLRSELAGQPERDDREGD